MHQAVRKTTKNDLKLKHENNNRNRNLSNLSLIDLNDYEEKQTTRIKKELILDSAKNIILADEEEIKFESPATKVSKLDPKAKMINSISNANAIKPNNNKSLIDSIVLLEESNQPIQSTFNKKICRLTDNNVKTLVEQEFKTPLSGREIRILKYKVYKKVSYTKLNNSICSNEVSIVKPLGKDENLLINIEFDNKKHSFAYYETNPMIDCFHTAMFYKLDKHFIIGGLVSQLSQINNHLKSTEFWDHYKVERIDVVYYQNIKDLMCDICHKKDKNERISLSAKICDKISIKELVNDGYMLNHKRYSFLSYKQSRIQVKLSKDN